jgi:hypothetical protein
MTKENTFSNAVKEALAKKQEAAKPEVKNKKTKNKQNYGVPRITGAPVRKASGRGG